MPGKNARYRQRLSRRTLLRGAGGVAIALPFLEEMRARSVFAAEGKAAPRLVTVFFGQGCPVEYVQNGLALALAPLAPLASKLGIYGSVEFINEGPPNGHPRGSLSCFVGAKAPSENRSGGASIDRHLMGEKYPNGVPTPLQLSSVGSYFGNKAAYQHVRSWNPDGSPADVPLRSPAAIFKRYFGGGIQRPAATGQPSVAASAGKYRASVLDSVVQEYRRLSGEGGGLGASSRSRIKDHLEHIRTLELRIMDTPAPASCSVGAAPGDPSWVNSDRGLTLVPSDWQKHWQIIADLQALALHCDLVRFGNVTFQGSAERILLKGPWDYDGAAITFNDSQDNHEHFHAYSAGSGLRQPFILRHLHFIMTQVAYFLTRLDDPAYPQANGGTFLENNLVMVSTELGDHGKHQMDRVFHALSGAGGLFKTGVVDANTKMHCVELYRTILKAMGANDRFGEDRFFAGYRDNILA